MQISQQTVEVINLFCWLSLAVLALSAFALFLMRARIGVRMFIAFALACLLIFALDVARLYYVNIHVVGVARDYGLVCEPGDEACCNDQSRYCPSP
jgi:hypothetical protein